MQKLGIDVLCFTGHKGLLGPQGTGGMYVRSGVEIRPLLSGGSGIDTYNTHHPAQMPTALEAGDAERARDRGAWRGGFLYHGNRT